MNADAAQLSVSFGFVLSLNKKTLLNIEDVSIRISEKHTRVTLF